jgi:hypothetical protein
MLSLPLDEKPRAKSSTIYMSRCIERLDVAEDRLGLHLHEACVLSHLALTLCLFHSRSDAHIFTYTTVVNMPRFARYSLGYGSTGLYRLN